MIRFCSKANGGQPAPRTITPLGADGFGFRPASVRLAEGDDGNGDDGHGEERAHCDDPDLVLHLTVLTAPELDGSKRSGSTAEPPLNGRTPDRAVEARIAPLRA